MMPTSMMPTWRRVWMVLFAAIITVAGAPAGAVPDVVVSIKPLHSLVAGVMEGIARPHLLIDGRTSAHTYSLKPSQARLLRHADVVFWTGPAMETFLVKPLHVLTGAARVTAFSRPARTDASGTDSDPHIWLDPVNGKRIVSEAAAILAAVDPANAGLYARNARVMAARLDALDGTLRTRLAPLRGKPYFVLHDAFGHLARRYGLADADALEPAPGRPPGARRIAVMRRNIADAGATCLFHEPGAAPRRIATLIEGTDAKNTALDPLGGGVAPGPDAYFILMRTLVQSFAACLSAE